MNCQYHFIISVGTSLIEKIENKHPCSTKDWLGNYEFELCFENEKLKDPEKICGHPYWKDIQRLLGNHSGETAELKTVRKIFENIRSIKYDQCCFHLISTRTATGAYCASVLNKWWNEKEAQTINVYFPEGLGEPTESTFTTQGLPNLLTRVAEIMDEVEKDHANGKEVSCIVVPTGGYKAIIPYLTIASIIYTHPAYYIYEESDELVRLPAPPLGVDVAKFRARFALLQNIEDLDTSTHKVYYEALGDEGLQTLFDKGPEYKLNPFGRRLKSMFTKSQEEALVLYATTNTLLNFLENDDREAFKRLANIGASVWIGDKAPEMAEHARYHHLNLFSYAELLLFPILKEKKDFLHSKQLLLLLGVIYLHDCGHTLDFLSVNDGGSKVPLLQTEIRKYHNLLGYYRIRDHLFQEALKRQGVELSSQFFEAVATVSLYHRKKMPLLLRSDPYNGPDGREYSPLQEINMEWGSTEMAGHDLAFIAALFRIIDGMDKQVARAGDAVQIVMKAEALLAELESQWQKLVMLKNVINDLSEKHQQEINELNEQLRKVIEGMKEESPEGEDSENAQDCKGWSDACAENKGDKASSTPGGDQAFYCKLQEITGDKGKDLKALLWAYSVARIRFAYLLSQPYHYYTDLILDHPKVTVTKNKNSNFGIKISYNLNNETEIQAARDKLTHLWEKIQKTYTSKLQDLPEAKLLNHSFPEPDNLGIQLVNGIRNEYCNKASCQVAKILDKRQVRVSFYYNGQVVKCWKVK